MALPLSSANAATSDSLIDGAKLCTRHLPRYEREYGIPTHLLSAIASTESGRYHDGLKIKLPWPWTINADNKSYFFDNKDEAIGMVRKLRARGIQSIDVGCMQVNLYHHPGAFASLDRAFDPETNIAYAAGFLRSLYDQENSWKKAAADYHSKTPRLGKDYVGLVYNSWYTIIEKLREARLQVPGSEVVAMNEMKDAPGIINVTSAPKNVPVKVTRLPEQHGRKVAAYHPPHMNSIHIASVETADSREDNSIIVVRPDIKVVEDTPIVTASANAPLTASPTTLVVAQQVPAQPVTDAKIITTAKPQPISAVAVAPKKTGPNFVFSD